jgi:hypothetical protein
MGFPVSTAGLFLLGWVCRAAAFTAKHFSISSFQLFEPQTTLLASIPKSWIVIVFRLPL